MCWGWNNEGELGDGTMTPHITPGPVSLSGHTVTQVSTGYTHTCALLGNGGVRCWGYNGYGQLGDGTNDPSDVPVKVVGLLSGVAEIATGDESTCAVLIAGGVKCWGWNGWGQLGNGDVTLANQKEPVDVVGLSGDAVHITVGSQHACAVISDGSVQCWGYDALNSLGDGGAAGVRSVTPVDVTGLSGPVAQIDAGDLHTCALITGGALQCWGDNESGQLGGTPGPGSTTADVTGLGSGVTQVSAGSQHTCAVQAGAALCWGWNYYGQIGNGTTNNASTPQQVSGLDSGVAQASAGGNHSCALLTDGTIKCWGSDSSGQLGDGNSGDGFDQAMPVVVLGIHPEADLDVTLTDSPDPVTSPNDVLYHFVVHNGGPEAADAVTLTDTPDSSVTVESMPAECSGGGGEDITCGLGTLPSGGSHAVDIVVQSPTTASQTVISTSAFVSSSTGDPDPDNNSASETTTVNPGDDTSASGYVPPEGGQVSTGTAATSADPIALTMDLPPGGPGGSAQVTELGSCAPFPTCTGSATNWVPPPGYNQVGLSITATITYDASILPAARVGATPAPGWKLLYKKGKHAIKTLPRCKKVANVPPCMKSAKFLHNGDLRVTGLINSDPKLATRK